MRSSITAVITIVLIFAANNIWAQSAKTLESSLPNYYKALNSGNDGMIESAIENLVKLKIMAPDLDYSKAAEKLEQLTEDGETDQIQYKAFIASLYLQHPERFNWLSSEDTNKKLQMAEDMLAKLEQQIKK